MIDQTRPKPDFNDSNELYSNFNELLSKFYKVNSNSVPTASSQINQQEQDESSHSIQTVL